MDDLLDGYDDSDWRNFATADYFPEATPQSMAKVKSEGSGWEVVSRFLGPSWKKDTIKQSLASMSYELSVAHAERLARREERQRAKAEAERLAAEEAARQAEGRGHRQASLAHIRGACFQPPPLHPVGQALPVV